MLDKLKQNRFWWYQGPMILWAVALFTQSSIPATEIPSFWVFSYDKVIHALIYVVFAWAVHRAIANQTTFPLLARHQYLFTFLIVALYGATDEVHQYFVPERSCSLYDWFADCFGAILFLTFAWLAAKIRLAVSAFRS
jgi:VanZ family protein